MAELVWDEMDKRFFETGVSKGVVYTPVAGVYTTGVAWSGLTSVTSAPSGAEATAQYADNIKYVSLLSAEEWGGTIECFTYPEEFLVHDGVVKTANGLQVSMQSRPVFGFSWRTEKGNANDPELGYVIHMAYGLQAQPSEKANNTINDSPELATLSFTVTATPVAVTGMKPTAKTAVDSTDADVDPTGLSALEDELYGRAAVVSPNLPLPDAVDTLLSGA